MSTVPPAIGQLPLRDIHAAPPPEWWPPAPGWWLLAAAVAVTLAWLVRRWVLRQRRRELSRRVVAELDQLHAGWITHGQDERLLSELSTYLRRVGLALGGQSVAGITGPRWLAKLEQLGGVSGVLTTGPAVALIDAPYRRAAAHDAVAVYQAVHRYAEQVSEKLVEGHA